MPSDSLIKILNSYSIILLNKEAKRFLYSRIRQPVYKIHLISHSFISTFRLSYNMLNDIKKIS